MMLDQEKLFPGLALPLPPKVHIYDTIRGLVGNTCTTCSFFGALSSAVIIVLMHRSIDDPLRFVKVVKLSRCVLLPLPPHTQLPHTLPHV